MLDVDDLHEYIVELVVVASGMPEGQIQLMLGGELPEIPGLYCSVRMNTDRTVGAPSPKYRASETEHVLDQLIHVATEVEFSINFFRSGAMQYANNMKSAPYRWQVQDRKSSRLNSSHVANSYAVFSLKKTNYVTCRNEAIAK